MEGGKMSRRILVLLIFSGGVFCPGNAYQLQGLQNGGALLVESESTDPVLAIPDSAVWDATGSGSGSEDDDDDAKTASVVELKIDNGNSPQIEGNSDRPRIEAGRSLEVVEVKDDGEKPQVEAKEFENSPKRDEKLQGEVTMPSKSENNTSKNITAFAAKNVKTSALGEISNNNEAAGRLPNVDQPKSLADLLKDDEDMSKPMPKFDSISEELKWKFNKARNDLKKAKQIVQLAEHIARKKHKETTEERAVKDIITKTEVAMVHAGEKMGLDYMHYRRRRSIDDDEDEFD